MGRMLGREVRRWRPALYALATLSLILTYVLSATPGVTAKPVSVAETARLGTGSCAGSTCHGRQEATGAVVRQDELRIWQDPSSPAGAHHRAWRVLGEPRSRAIAANLGIGDPQAAPACLGCHSDVPAATGAGFRLDDGIGCEACHGAAAGWLASHYAVGGSHASNVARGMRPLDRPRERAELCLDCHLGSDRPGQFVDHKMMAAGHPRLSFELDLFTTMQQHWNVDADYARRKQAPGAAATWAIGQASALSRALALYANPGRGQAGAFPEFYFFDCHSCHRRISDEPGYRPTPTANPGRGIAPGRPPFQDENMIQLAAAARVAAPDLAAGFEADSRAFHRSFEEGRGASVAAAGRLRARADGLAARFAATPLGAKMSFAMIAALADTVTAPRYTDYEGSVQAVMGIDTLLSGLINEGAVPRAAAARIRPDIDRAYQAVRDPNAYQPPAFRAAIGRAAAAIGGLR